MTETRKRAFPAAAVTGVIAFVTGLFVASVAGWTDRERPIEQGRISYLAHTRFDTRSEIKLKDNPEGLGHGWLYSSYLIYETRDGKKRLVIPRENMEEVVFE